MQWLAPEALKSLQRINYVTKSAGDHSPYHAAPRSEKIALLLGGLAGYRLI